MGQEVKIKIRAFPYYVEEEDPTTGQEVRIERIATRGDVVELSDQDLARAKKFDAIMDPEEDLPQPGEQPPPDDSVEGLTAWIENEKPTVQEVLDRAEGNPELAQRLIEAENLATGQQPRTSLIEGLEKIDSGSGA